MGGLPASEPKAFCPAHARPSRPHASEPRQQHAAEHGWCEAPFYVSGERQLWRLGKAYLDSYAELPSKAEVAAAVGDGKSCARVSAFF